MPFTLLVFFCRVYGLTFCLHIWLAIYFTISCYNLVAIFWFTFLSHPILSLFFIRFLCRIWWLLLFTFLLWHILTCHFHYLSHNLQHWMRVMAIFSFTISLIASTFASLFGGFRNFLCFIQKMGGFSDLALFFLCHDSEQARHGSTYQNGPPYKHHVAHHEVHEIFTKHCHLSTAQHQCVTSPGTWRKCRKRHDAEPSPQRQAGFSTLYDFMMLMKPPPHKSWPWSHISLPLPSQRSIHQVYFKTPFRIHYLTR